MPQFQYLNINDFFNSCEYKITIEIFLFILPILLLLLLLPIFAFAYNFFSCNFFLYITIFKIFTSQNLFPHFLRFFMKCISKSFNNSSFKCDNQLSFNLKNINSCLILFLILEFIILYFYLLTLKSTSVFLYDLPNTNFHLR